MDLREFLEQHDRARQLLLEGERAPWLGQHVATCAVCGPLAARLDELDRMIADVPEPRPELLRRILWSDDPRAATGRIEVLWPTVPAPGSPNRGGRVSPVVLAVEADRYPYTPRSRPVERFVVVARYPIVVGRAPDVDVSVWDRSASRRHAQLDWRGDRWTLRDLESTNGTRVNGARVGNTQPANLRPGDEIEIGHHARLVVRTLLPALDPAGIAREVRRFLSGAARQEPAPPGSERQSDELRARLGGLREETVQLRDELSSIASQGAGPDALPMVYERLTNMLAVLEQELLA
jgi:pSer/pThr/pTyr-binding forkhead associated (FHA) protein